MTLLQLVQELLKESGDSPKITPEMIEQRLLKYRLFDPKQVADFLGDRTDVQVNTGTGLITVELRDLYGTYQYFAGPSGIHLHRQGRYFLIDDDEYVEESGCGFTFDAAGFTLNFEEPLSGPAEGYAIGHVVNIEGAHGVMYDCIGLMKGWATKLVNLRGQEFKNLAANLERWQMQYGAGFVKVGSRVH